MGENVLEEQDFQETAKDSVWNGLAANTNLA